MNLARIVILLGIAALVIPAAVSAGSTNATIEETALLLDAGQDAQTVANIERYIMYNFAYEFSHEPADPDLVWETKTGDCTDRSILIAEMLEECGIVDAKVVHGWVYPDGKPVKHDWVEVTIRVDGCGEFDRYERDGVGYW